MTLSAANILSEAADKTRELFRTTGKPSLDFHNFYHTENVVRACTEMADHYRLAEEDRLALLVAAWFHDTGYLENGAYEHEKASVAIAGNFIAGHNIPAETAAKIYACISVTKMPQNPATLIEKIICDADLFHLGLDTFIESSKALRQEVNASSSEFYTKPRWAAKSIALMESHRYFTDYCIQRLEPVKQNNLKKLKKKYPEEITVIRQEIKRANPVTNINPPETDVNSDAKKETKLKEERLGRGVETMFRTTSSNHLKLSEMADSKANIMISVNSIILSVTISVLLTKLDRYPNLIFPTALLLIVCVVAIIFSILATRPNITSGKFVKEEIQDQKPNLLFFGNFHEMSLEDYSWGMKELMNNREYLYGSMIKDIYSLGVVLANKYKYLRISYNVFMYGLISSVIAFGIASFFTPDQL